MNINPDKTRLEVWIPKTQKTRLATLAIKTGYSVAEIVRRAIDMIEKELGK